MRLFIAIPVPEKLHRYCQQMQSHFEELKKTKKAVKGYAPAFEVATMIRQDKSKKFILGKRTIAAIRREFGGHTVKKKK